MTEGVIQTDPPRADEHSMTPAKRLEAQFDECGLIRPFRRTRYEPGDRLIRTVTGVMPAHTGRATLAIERFVGGGFAGQVYRVTLVDLQSDEGPIDGLEVGKSYAIKILKPPSGFSCWFRDFLYLLAYQGPFSAQVQPAAVRSGVLWQKLIRRAARDRFGTEEAVADTYATFHDDDLHSFGEINEWITGRVWRFEVDERLFERWDFTGDPPADANSAEYVHKKLFMAKLVAMLHEMGAPELARQYEWWTCKSQPNALKRLDADHSPRAGLTAVDFRAGLALLPFLPMSPADFWLILRGLAHGRIVQFDRTDRKRFEQFIEQHRDLLADLEPAIEELRRQETIHRRSLPDVTHNHFRLLTDKGLRQSIKEGTITAWRNLGRLDDDHAARLSRGRVLFGLLFLVSFVPVLGTLVVKLWGSTVRRTHVKRMMTSASYLWRAMRGSRIEALVAWQRCGRVCDERAIALTRQPVRFWAQRILVGWLPAKWHRFLTEPAYARRRIAETIHYTLQFLRNPTFREQWLIEQVGLGCQEGMLTSAEAQKITSQIKDPFIQKYLRCLAVHVCTVPVTQVVMVLVGVAVGAYFLTVRQAGWAEAAAAGAAAGALVQILPISPGSIARGVFVLYLMIKERDVRSYYIAAPVSFLHVIGYLAFPLQMVAHDPALARFMAGRWATSAVGFVPVFGERGALPEHFVFDLFFNLPLSIKRSFKRSPVRWSIGSAVVAIAFVAMLYLGFTRIQEWRHSEVEPERARVTEVTTNADPHSEPQGWLTADSPTAQRRSVAPFGGFERKLTTNPGLAALRPGLHSVAASRLKALGYIPTPLHG